MRASLMLSAIVLVIQAVPSFAFGASGDNFMNSMQEWEKEINRMQEQMRWEDEEDAFYESLDLFPQGVTQLTTFERVRSERTEGVLRVSVGGETILFRDVPIGSWFAPFVRDIAERGIVQGYRNTDGTKKGEYGPDHPVTVEQIGKIMLYASGKFDAVMTGSVMNLTASGSWSEPFVRNAEHSGWSVFADGTVDVRRSARRSEVVVTLLQAFDVVPHERTGNVFDDVTLSTQFGSFIEQAERDGIITGYTDAQGNRTGLFGPDENVTRAELAKIVSVGMQVYGSSR